MKRTRFYYPIVFAIALSLAIALPGRLPAECIDVEDDLKLNISCGEFSGTFLSFGLDFSDPANLLWRMDLNSVAFIDEAPNCTPIAADLTMFISCVEVAGLHYNFNLIPFPMPQDPSNFFFALDTGTLNVNSGSELFIQRCGACHTGNGMGTGTVGDRTGRTTVQIQNAISRVGAMNSLSTLTLSEIEAIADALRP